MSTMRRSSTHAASELGGAASRAHALRRSSSTLVPSAGRRGTQVEIFLLREGAKEPTGEMFVDLVDRAGFGMYQALMMPLLIGVVMAEGSEMLITSSVTAGVRRDFGITATQQGSLSSVAFLGLALGTAISGVIADTYGRRVAVLGGYLLMAIFGTLSAAANSFVILISLRFLNGTACGLGVAGAISLLAEICPQSVRPLSFVILTIALTLGEIYAACGLLIFMPDLEHGSWRMATLWAAAPSALLFVLAFFLLRESAQWLAVAGRLPEARDVLLKTARANGTLSKVGLLASTASPTPRAARRESAAALLLDRVNEKTSEKQKKDSSLTMQQVVRLLATQRSLGWNMFFLSWCFIIGNMLLFGLSYVWPKALREMANTDRVDLMAPALQVVVIRSFGFIAAAVAFGAMASSFGHRSVIEISSVVCAGGLVWSYFEIDNQGGWIVASSAIVMVSANTYYVALMALCSESFPTVVRSLGVGWTIMVGRFGAIATPLFVEWYGVRNFLCIAAIACCLAACLMMPLTETKGQPLVDYPEELLRVVAERPPDYGSAGPTDVESALEDGSEVWSDSAGSSGKERSALPPGPPRSEMPL